MPRGGRRQGAGRRASPPIDPTPFQPFELRVLLAGERRPDHRMVMALTVLGCSPKEIGDVLGRRERTILNKFADTLDRAKFLSGMQVLHASFAAACGRGMPPSWPAMKFWLYRLGLDKPPAP